MRINNIFGILFISGFLQAYITGYTQQAQPPKVIPPSPDASAFQKYGDIPVSAYTGTPNISIPLFELKSGDISVPISISYNSSGIKVAEEASRVGLGWVLNAGGVISRSVIGRDDWDDYHSQTSFEIPFGPKTDQGYDFNFRYLCPVVINGFSIPDNVLSGNSLSDFQPDQYSYNFNGHSGKFVLRRNKNVVLNKTEKIDIRLSDPVNATSWEIKTPDGFLYRFEDIETYIDNNSPFSHKSSWYLSSITSPAGRIIQFIYTTIIQNIQPSGSYFESKPVSIFTNGCGASLPPIVSNTIAGNAYHSLYLSKISCDQAEIQFNYSSGRADVPNDVQLNGVQLYSKKPGEPNTLLKTWNFSYSYFTGTDMNGSITNSDALSKRLKLVSLQETSQDSSLPPYTFYYNEDFAVLPAKLSFARDHWGHFNGKYSNTSLVPGVIGGGGGTINAGAMGGERSVDPNYSQFFILKKIQYPTGGFTQFEFESNDFDEPNSIINDHSFFANYTAALPASVQNGYSNIQAGGNFTGTLDLSNMYPFVQDVKIEFSLIKYSGFASGTAVIQDITYSLNGPSSLISSGQISTWLGSGAPPGQYMTEYLGTAQQNTGVKFTMIKSLAPGIYTFNFYVPSSYAVNNANVVTWYTKGEGFDPISSGGDIVYNALFGGGLRIKRIIDYSDPVTPAKVRKYNYHYQLNGKTYSYGRRMAKPNYSYYALVPGTDCLIPCLIWESDSNIPLNGNTNGVAVGYDKVEELIGENGENGKTVYEYKNQPDIILDYRDNSQWGATLPLKPPYGGTISDAGNGNLLRQTTFANINGQFIKTNETNNTYQELSDYYASVVYGIEKRPMSSTSGGFNCGIGYYIYPANTINRSVLSFASTKIYDVSGATLPVVTAIDYTYDNSTHLQLISKSEYKSNGDKLTTSFKYPADFPDAQCDAALLQMKGPAYMHALPVTQQLTMTRGTNQYLNEAQINRYQVLNNKIFLKEKAALENVQPVNMNTLPAAYNPAGGSYPSGYVARLFFDNYDASGNIIQVHKSDDASMAYIWDYYSNYPIAEITNAAPANCAFTSFEADGTGNWVFSGSAVNDPLPFTGKRTYTLNGSNNVAKPGLDASKIYIVSYWSKAGSAIVNGSMAAPGITRPGWTYYEHVLPANTSSVTVTGSVTVDELRLFPKGSLMTTCTYEPLTGMTSQCDANNRITYYEYDGFQRLKLIKDQDGNIIKTIEYKYKQ